MRHYIALITHNNYFYKALLINMQEKISAPLLKNGRFAIFMYLLGMIPLLLIHQGGRHISIFELFVDVYLLCVILYQLPVYLCRWVKGVFYVIAYGLTIFDMFCYTRFGAPINSALFRLCTETSQREAVEAITSYVTLQSLSWQVMLIFLLMFLQVATTKYKLNYRLKPRVVISILTVSVVMSARNKVFIIRNLIEPQTSFEYEYAYDLPHDGRFYLPFYRLLHAWKGYSIDRLSIEKLERNISDAVVDSCSFRSPNIVLIIGEAYSRRHSQLYGYNKATTPRQMQLAQEGSLTAFTDVISPYHQTSQVFRLAFSLYAYGMQGDWTDYPLFPQLFKKAGYQVFFITNQFVPSPAQDVFDFSGSVFLNTPILSQSLFSHRNTHTHTYDMGLLEDYDSLYSYRQQHNLYLFHLLGQHTGYFDRHTEKENIFSSKDYQRNDLQETDLYELAHYDNACIYNDKVVTEIIQRFASQEAIIIYMPDHGEMCYDGTNIFGRTLEVNTKNEIEQQFEIPFWIWTSDSYRKRNPDICQQISKAQHLPFMTDNISQVLLYLAGIKCPGYQDKANLLSPHYDASRKRMIMGTIDYDQTIKPKGVRRISQHDDI